MTLFEHTVAWNDILTIAPKYHGPIIPPLSSAIKFIPYVRHIENMTLILVIMIRSKLLSASPVITFVTLFTESGDKIIKQEQYPNLYFKKQFRICSFFDRVTHKVQRPDLRGLLGFIYLLTSTQNYLSDPTERYHAY